VEGVDGYLKLSRDGRICSSSLTATHTYQNVYLRWNSNCLKAILAIFSFVR